MAIFPNLIYEPTIQISDRTRLDGTKSWVTQDEDDIVLVQIEPASGHGFISVTEDKFLDWEYAASGVQDVTILVATESATGQISRAITVISSSDDHLFSTDSDIQIHEPSIMKWVQDGRNSYLDVHRRAQTIILKWLDREGYVDASNKPYTKQAIVNIEEVKQWSTYIVLRLIFEGISNAINDVFAQKKKFYNDLEIEWKNRTVLRLDTDGDGEVEHGEELNISVGFIARR